MARRWNQGPRFVVTGTGRSGTAYIAQLLTACGIPCGHEEYFKPQPGLREEGAVRYDPLRRIRRPVGQLREHVRRSRLDWEGEASWLAVPRLGNYRGTVVLQLRHPLPVIRSFLARGFFESGANHPHRRFAERYFSLTGDPVIDAMRWWQVWNESAAQRADIIYPLERVEDCLVDLLADLGVDNADESARRGLERLAGPVNATTRNAPQVGWGDLPNGEAKLAAQRSAVRWGYAPDDESKQPPATILRPR